MDTGSAGAISPGSSPYRNLEPFFSFLRLFKYPSRLRCASSRPLLTFVASHNRCSTLVLKGPTSLLVQGAAKS
jgi:hypothetical protein